MTKRTGPGDLSSGRLESFLIALWKRRESVALKRTCVTAPLADNVFRPRSSLLLLRLIDPTDAREQFKMFVRDLRLCRIERRTAGAIAAIEMSLRCLIKSPGPIPIDRVAGATHNQDVVNAGCRRSAKN